MADVTPSTGTFAGLINYIKRKLSTLFKTHHITIYSAKQDNYYIILIVYNMHLFTKQRLRQ